MNIIAWNIRGAAGMDFRRAFRELIAKYNPDAVILLETRTSGQHATTIISSLGFENYIKIDAMGFSGGIWLLWNPHNITIEPLASSFLELHCKVTVKNSSFILSAIYASPTYALREKLWSNLSKTFSCFNLPWIIMGDFNDISYPREKFGRCPPSRKKIETFNNFLNSCNLIDLGFSGPLFTWTNNREHGRVIRTRIDRCHANPNWINLFPDSKVFHLPRIHSDHCPLLLKTHHAHFHRNKIFRLESFWVSHHSFPLFVQSHWHNNEVDIDENINNIKYHIKDWSLKNFGNIFKDKKRLLARLLDVQNKLCYNPSPQLHLLEKDLLNQLNILLKNEDDLWHMKSRLNWLNLGDRNTVLSSKYYCS